MTRAIFTPFRSVIVRYHGPSNTKGSRFTAMASDGPIPRKMTRSYNHALSADDNAQALAIDYVKANNWNTLEKLCLIGGHGSKNDRIFFLVSKHDLARLADDGAPTD